MKNTFSALFLVLLCIAAPSIHAASSLFTTSSKQQPDAILEKRIQEALAKSPTVFFCKETIAQFKAQVDYFSTMFEDCEEKMRQSNGENSALKDHREYALMFQKIYQESLARAEATLEEVIKRITEITIEFF